MRQADLAKCPFSSRFRYTCGQPRTVRSSGSSASGNSDDFQYLCETTAGTDRNRADRRRSDEEFLLLTQVVRFLMLRPEFFPFFSRSFVFR